MKWPRRRLLCFPTLILFSLFAGPTSAIIGDLNNDGTVDFSDFFIFADNFGKRSDAVPAEIGGTNATWNFDFSDDRYLSDWSRPSRGTWGVGDSTLTVSGEGEGGPMVELGPPTYFPGEVDVSVETEWRSGISAAYGIKIRIGTDGRALAFGITAFGTYDVSIWDAESILRVIASAESATIRHYGRNVVRVRTEGSMLRFYINGTKVYEVTDITVYGYDISAGKVGLFVAGELEVAYDNLVIRTPPNQILERRVVVHDTITVKQPTVEYAIESRIDGDFDGWDGDTIFRLENGQVWQQVRYAYTYRYANRPEVVIYRASGGFKMRVAGVDGYVYVERIK